MIRLQEHFANLDTEDDATTYQELMALPVEQRREIVSRLMGQVSFEAVATEALAAPDLEDDTTAGLALSNSS